MKSLKTSQCGSSGVGWGSNPALCPQRQRPPPSLIERMQQETDTPPKMTCPFASGCTVTGKHCKLAASVKGGVSIMVGQLSLFGDEELKRGRAERSCTWPGYTPPPLSRRAAWWVSSGALADWMYAAWFFFLFFLVSVCRRVVWMVNANAKLLCHVSVFTPCIRADREQWGSGCDHFLLNFFRFVTLVTRCLKSCKWFNHQSYCTNIP